MPEYIALTRITIHALNQVIERFQPFPSGIAEVDYQKLLDNKLIATFADYQRIDMSGRCLTCGE